MSERDGLMRTELVNPERADDRACRQVMSTQEAAEYVACFKAARAALAEAQRERATRDHAGARLVLKARERGDEFWQYELRILFDLTFAEAEALAVVRVPAATETWRCGCRENDRHPMNVYECPRCGSSRVLRDGDRLESWPDGFIWSAAEGRPVSVSPEGASDE